MKYIDEEKRKKLAQKALAPHQTFNFQCHAALACFNKCCRNLNLFLYPYDVLRLSRHLEISTDQFIERELQQMGVPDDFKYLALQESTLNGDAVSSSNAVGYWQFKEATASEYQLKLSRAYIQLLR